MLRVAYILPFNKPYSLVIGTILTGHSLHLQIFELSVLLLSVLFGSNRLSHIIMNFFSLRFGGICLCTALWTAQIITPLPPSLTVSMTILVFTKCGTVHYSQTSPFWPCVSKGHFSRNFFVCPDVTLHT